MKIRSSRLLRLSLLLALSGAAPALAADPPGDPLLAEAQRGLLVLGFNPGKTAGLVTPQTIQALQAFQRQQGLPVTGRADDATMAKLRDRRDNNPNQVLGNPKTGAPDRRPAAPAIEPHPQPVGPAVAVGGEATPDAPKNFNPVAGAPSSGPTVAPRMPGGEPPAPIAAAPQAAVSTDRVALPPGQSSGTLLNRALEEAQQGQTWLHWIWAPIAGLLVVIGAGAWWRAGRSSNPYLGGGAAGGGTQRREPTLGSQER